ncbi:MAG: fibronectin type III domain-containing protein [Ruminococcus sp.]|nr:fibronectin type III domain-containing protein [Ruminococcus sp.]
MKKKILAAMLSVSLMFAAAEVLPNSFIDLGNGIKAEAVTEGITNYNYQTLSDGTIEITSYTGTSTTVSIPSSIGGKNVTKIGDQAFYKSKVTSVTIPSTVKTVGKDAFRESVSLDTVVFKGGTTSIGSYAFYKCTSLKKVELPSTLKTIDNYVFYGCSALPSIEIPNNVSTVGSYCFENCSNLAMCQLPSNLKELQDDTFAWCTSLQFIRVPDYVKTIGWRAFTSCTSLRTVILPNSLKTISDEAFNRCKAITEISIPNSVTEIGDGAFENCTSLKNVFIPTSVKKIGSYTFGFTHATGAASHFRITDFTFTVFGSTLTASNYAAFYGIRYVDTRLSKATITLSQNSYAYDGTFKKPTVIVKNNGVTLRSGTDYTVSYQNNKAIGTATVVVKGNGNFTETVTKTFKINLGTVTGFKNAAVSANAIKFTWNKVPGAQGYVVYLYNKSTKQWERYAKTTNDNNVQLVNKLNPGEAYALTAKAYRTVNGKEILSPSFNNYKTSTNPAKVSFSVASKAKGSATYSWNKVTGATSYALYYKSSANASWTRVATVNNSTTSYTKTCLKSGTGYFTVRAFRTYEGTTYGSTFDTKTVTVR